MGLVSSHADYERSVGAVVSAVQPAEFHVFFRDALGFVVRNVPDLHGLVAGDGDERVRALRGEGHAVNALGVRVQRPQSFILSDVDFLDDSRLRGHLNHKLREKKFKKQFGKILTKNVNGSK